MVYIKLKIHNMTITHIRSFVRIIRSFVLYMYIPLVIVSHLLQLLSLLIAFIYGPSTVPYIQQYFDVLVAVFV